MIMLGVYGQQVIDFEDEVCAKITIDEQPHEL